MAAKYKQVDFVTKSKKAKNRGGKRENAGRKSIHGGETKTIRGNIDLIPAIEKLKAGCVDFVTNSSEELQAVKAELEKYKAANAKLVEERDKYYRRVIELENQNSDLKRQPDKLRAEITRLKHLEQDCQAIKANGDRCDRIAKGKVNFHGVLINVCLQHQNQLMKT
jgi:chromosome segregation ATPase